MQLTLKTKKGSGGFLINDWKEQNWYSKILPVRSREESKSARLP